MRWCRHPSVETTQGRRSGRHGSHVGVSLGRNASSASFTTMHGPQALSSLGPSWPECTITPCHRRQMKSTKSLARSVTSGVYECV